MKLPRSIKFFCNAFQKLRNPLEAWKDFLYLSNEPYVTIRFDNNVKQKIRKRIKNIVSDIEIIEEVILNDQYNLRNLDFSDEMISVLDVGAHIGTFPIHLKLTLPQKIFIYDGFEPDPDNFKLLKYNIQVNKATENFNITQKGINSTPEQTKLYLNRKNISGHSIFNDFRGKPLTIKNTSINRALKNILSRKPSLDILKMDCEGAEYPILFNIEDKYLTRIKYILFELHKTRNIIKKYDPEKLLEFLRHKGFHIHILDEIYYPDEGTFWIVQAKNIDTTS